MHISMISCAFAASGLVLVLRGGVDVAVVSRGEATCLRAVLVNVCGAVDVVGMCRMPSDVGKVCGTLVDRRYTPRVALTAPTTKFLSNCVFGANTSQWTAVRTLSHNIVSGPHRPPYQCRLRTW